MILLRRDWLQERDVRGESVQVRQRPLHPHDVEVRRRERLRRRQRRR